MPGINLLPQELKPSGYALKASKSLKGFSVLSIVAVLLLVISYVVANVFLSLQSRTLKTKEENLKNSIKALEQTEQKLVLIEDRLTGIQKIVSNNSAREEIEVLQSIIEKNPQNITLTDLKLDKEQLIISIMASSSQNLTNFFSLLMNSNFSRITLDGFNYSPVSGYKVDIAISK